MNKRQRKKARKKLDAYLIKKMDQLAMHIIKKQLQLEKKQWLADVDKELFS